MLRCIVYVKSIIFNFHSKMIDHHSIGVARGERLLGYINRQEWCKTQELSKYYNNKSTPYYYYELKHILLTTRPSVIFFRYSQD